MLNNHVDDANTVSTLAGFNGWLKLDIAVAEVNLNVEHWWKLVLLVVLDADLIRQVSHGALNSLSDTLNDETIAVINVSKPSE